MPKTQQILSKQEIQFLESLGIKFVQQLVLENSKPYKISILRD
jgi:hypothetical protein